MKGSYYGFFDILTMLGGLCLFLFGMNIMGESLERRAGSSLRTILGKLTTNKALGFLTGLVVTGIIQSSSATTVMVVGFIWSDLLTSLERIGDHCSNVAGCVMDLHHHDMNIHESLRALKVGSPDFKIRYQNYSNKYNLA